jgi:hypothetical protein
MLLLCEYPKKMDSTAGSPLMQGHNVEVFVLDVQLNLSMYMAVYIHGHPSVIWPKVRMQSQLITQGYIDDMIAQCGRVVEHLAYIQRAWVQSPVWPYLGYKPATMFNSDGAVITGTSFPLINLFTVVDTPSGFWQYGTLQWDEFHRYLITFIVTPGPWVIFEYDPAQQQHGALCPSDARIVQPGNYIILSDSK